jgi:transaldolase
LKIVPGRVSTEVPAALSYETEATIKEALNIIAQYKKMGISKERILIKIASTWQGIQAAGRLEQEHGIHCNLTLLFNLAQAIACAESGVTLISPFVGRILDWHKRAHRREYSAAEDPGVLSVRSIYNYFKKFGYGTVVMGASFRNVGEIEELAGVDFLTISPALLDQLAKSDRSLHRKLSPEQAKSADLERLHMTQELFEEMMAKDPMATELLSDGIKKFDQDSQKLLSWLNEKIQTSQ